VSWQERHEAPLESLSSQREKDRAYFHEDTGKDSLQLRDGVKREGNLPRTRLVWFF
jgi:hypothetical protein